MINLRHMEVFHAVYQSGTISGAARVLRVSQPSVSKVLRHAEGLIGIPLFRVVKGRLLPTEEAHLLYAEAHELQLRVDRLKELIKNLRRGGGGHLRLAVLHSLGLDLIPTAVAAFRERHPEVTFELATAHSNQLIGSLLERSCDIAIGYDVPPHPRVASLHLGSAELVLLFHRDDMPDVPDRIAPEMLHGRTLIRLVNQGSIGALFNKYIEADALEAAAIEAHTYYVAAALVRKGAGIAVVDAFTARASLTPELDYRPFAEPLRFDVFGLYLEDQPMSQAGRLFLEAMRRQIAAMPMSLGPRTP